MMRVFIAIEWRMISMVKTVKGDNFEDIKAPVFHTVADELNGEVDFFSVDVDENPGLAAANKVFSVPTLILYKNGVEASRSVGAISKYDLLDFIGKIK